MTSWSTAPGTAAREDVYDPDEVVPKNSPLFRPLERVDLKLSPTSSVELADQKRDADDASSPEGSEGKPGRSGRGANLGDGVLIAFLDTDGRNRETAYLAARQALPSDCSEDTEHLDSDDSGDEAGALASSRRGSKTSRSHTVAAASAPNKIDAMLVDARTPPQPTGDGSPPALNDLQSLASSALGALNFGDHRAGIGNAKSRPPTNLNVSSDRNRILVDRGGRRDGPLKSSGGGLEKDDQDRIAEDRNPPLSATSPYSPRSGAYAHSPPQSGLSPIYAGILRSPASISTRSHAGELPPIQGVSSRSDSNAGQNPLPSIRDTLGDIGSFGETSPGSRRGSLFPHSPPGGLPPLGSLTVGSPPLSPNDGYRRSDLPSPGYSLSAAPSPYYAHHPVNNYPRHSIDYSSSSATETPGSTGDYVSSPANAQTAASDRNNAEGLSMPHGTFVCTFPGCPAPPFHTQYLLNSHANVHSSSRPWYCSVKNCPRSEGGKGFKRKNEMIRHGLVHESPGYICPFCPDREHKYPRPDNLQRHVRVHHVDKDKDDPMLREVLAQRPDGPSRGRRRRHGPG